MSQNNFNFLTGILIGFLPLSLILGVLISSTSIILIDLIFLLYCIRNKFWSWINYPYIKIILFLYIYLLFNNFISIDNTLSSARNIGFIRYLIFVPAVIYFFKNTKYINIIFFIWFFTIIVTIFDVYFEFFNGVNILGNFQPIDTRAEIDPNINYGNRIVSFFKDEAIVGSFINSFFLIIVGFFFFLNKNKKKYFKYFFFLIIILIISSIVLSGERSNFIKAILGLLLFYYLCREFKIFHKIYGSMLVLTAIILMILSSNYLKNRYYGQFIEYLSSIEKISTSIDNKSPIDLYFKHYRSAYFVFKKNPILGVGNKNYGKSCFENHDEIIRGEMVCSTHPHQIYFELLAEHGLVGSFIILLIFAIIIFNNLKNYFKYNNKIHLGAIIYVLLIFLPLIPSGTFFGNYNSTIFWLNFSIMLAFEKKN